MIASTRHGGLSHFVEFETNSSPTAASVGCDKSIVQGAHIFVFGTRHKCAQFEAEADVNILLR
jgi:hypothetical protein